MFEQRHHEPNSAAAAAAGLLDSLTKDQALIILGMSARMRTRIVDLDRKTILDHFRRRRRKLDERMSVLRQHIRLAAFSTRQGKEFERQLKELEWEEIKVNTAAQLLLNAQRVVDLSRDFSWKPGVAFVSDDSKWLLFVKQQHHNRSVSVGVGGNGGRRVKENSSRIGQTVLCD